MRRNYIRRSEEYSKVKKVIESCENIYHAMAACNLVDCFYKKYGFCQYWSILSVDSFNRFKYFFDELDLEG